MGSLYMKRSGVKKDEAKAVEWYRKSAENGFAPAQFALAMAYDLGRGIKQDPAKGTEWLQKAADQNHPQSQTALAAKMERGVGVTKNPSKAALLYLRAAQQDHVQAMSRLANLYYTGNGVPLDYRRAGAWYKRAAKSDDPWAANNLAWFLATCPDESLQNGEQAMLFAARSLRIMDEAGEDQRYEMIDTKAACLARNGEFLEAILWQKRPSPSCLTKISVPKSANPSKTSSKAASSSTSRRAPATSPEPKVESEAAPLPPRTPSSKTKASPEKTSPRKRRAATKARWSELRNFRPSERNPCKTKLKRHGYRETIRGRHSRHSSFPPFHVHCRRPLCCPATRHPWIGAPIPAAQKEHPEPTIVICY